MVSRYPDPETISRVVVEDRDGRTWVFKKRPTILEWCDDYVQAFVGPKKVKKPAKVVKQPKSIIKKKKVKIPSSSESEGSANESESEVSDSSGLELPGGYQKMNLKYKKTKGDADVAKLAKKMQQGAKFETS